ncbi:esterase/lipase family protein [Kribbella lupini]|uniref:Alpha/beta fold hydrolase n=1 Tax=Kribbella lupini TaxID=291602 RepID=A0ABN2CHI4_9ACTN
MRKLLLTAITTVLLAGLATPAKADVLPVPSAALALANAAAHPDTSPAGSNDWSCRPTAAHPRPVVLVHGTVENMTFNWFTLSPLLKSKGYCVFAFNYGQLPGRYAGLPGSRLAGGVAPVPTSAGQLEAFVDRVLEATNSSRVDLVGHSQGGMMPRYYLKFLGGAAKVGHLVALSPSNHGTTVDGLAHLPGVPELLSTGLGPSVRDQIKGSELLRKLNAGGDTVPGVRYTVIQTRYDEVVTPYTSAFLTGPKVTNILLQDRCPLDASDHLSISFTSPASQYVVNALDPAHAKPVRCDLALPAVG